MARPFKGTFNRRVREDARLDEEARRFLGLRERRIRL